MSTVTQRSVQLFVAYAWILGFIGCVSIFVYKYFIAIVKPDISLLLPAAGSLLGFLTPQVTLVLVWMFEGKINYKRVNRHKAMIVGLCTIAYQLLVVICAYYGVIELVFEEIDDPEKTLSLNVAVVLSILGIFSFIGVIPIRLLFD